MAWQCVCVSVGVCLSAGVLIAEKGARGSSPTQFLFIPCGDGYGCGGVMVVVRTGSGSNIGN